MAWKAEEPPWNEAAKRIFDIVASAVGLIVLAPVIAVLALVVRLDSRGRCCTAARASGGTAGRSAC